MESKHLISKKSYGSAQLDFAEAQEALLSCLTGEQKAQLVRLVLSAEQMQDDLRRWLRHLEE